MKPDRNTPTARGHRALCFGRALVIVSVLGVSLVTRAAGGQATMTLQLQDAQGVTPIPVVSHTISAATKTVIAVCANEGCDLPQGGGTPPVMSVFSVTGGGVTNCVGTVAAPCSVTASASLSFSRTVSPASATCVFDKNTLATSDDQLVTSTPFSGGAAPAAGVAQTYRLRCYNNDSQGAVAEKLVYVQSQSGGGGGDYCADLEATSTDPYFTPTGWAFDAGAWSDAFPGQTIPAGLSVAPYIPLARTGYTGTRFTMPADSSYRVQLRSGGDAGGVERASGHLVVLSKCQGDFRQSIANPDLVSHPWESPECRKMTVATAGVMLTITSVTSATSGCKLPPGEYFFNTVYAGWGPGFLEPACPAGTSQCTRAWMVN